MPNGAIFIAPGAALGNGFYTNHTLPFVMAPELSIDIDSQEELEHASRLLRLGIESQIRPVGRFNV